MINNLKKKRKVGFTLVEVIIVLAIIAIIAAIAIPNLTKVRQDSKAKADTQTCETIKRTMTTLIVDETIKYNTALGTPNTLVIKAGGTVDENDNAPQGVFESDGKTEVTTTTLSKYFSELKIPQQDDGYGYKVTIDNEGTITSVIPLKQVNNVVTEYK